MNSPRRPLILGHRGAMGSAPENTLAAFARARELGADGIELDVMFSKDKRLILLHDDTLERTTNGQGFPTDYTLAELKALDAGRWFDAKFAGERIPTLPETFDVFKPHPSFLINIEIKSDERVDRSLADAVVAAIQRNALGAQVIISSFDVRMIQRVRQLAPKLRIAFLYSKPYDFHNLTFPVDALHPHWRLVDEALVQQAHARGQQVNVWTVNEPDDLRRMIAFGVDAIITNYPERLKAIRVNK